MGGNKYKQTLADFVYCTMTILRTLFIFETADSTFNTKQRKLKRLWLQLHGAIYRPDSFVLMLRYCANLKAIKYESTSLNRIVADKSHRVIVTYASFDERFYDNFFSEKNLILNGI